MTDSRQCGYTTPHERHVWTMRYPSQTPDPAEGMTRQVECSGVREPETPAETVHRTIAEDQQESAHRRALRVRQLADDAAQAVRSMMRVPGALDPGERAELSQVLDVIEAYL